MNKTIAGNRRFKFQWYSFMHEDFTDWVGSVIVAPRLSMPHIHSSGSDSVWVREAPLCRSFPPSVASVVIVTWHKPLIPLLWLSHHLSKTRMSAPHQQRWLDKQVSSFNNVDIDWLILSLLCDDDDAKMQKLFSLTNQWFVMFHEIRLYVLSPLGTACNQEDWSRTRRRVRISICV